MIMKSTTKVFTLLTITSALTACGGGGGGGAPVTAATSTSSVSTPTPAPAAGTIVSVVPPTNFTPSSEEEATFLLLNQERGRCGFGLLAQSNKLDQAAKSHTIYLVKNGLQYAHDEVAGLPFFTGTTEIARAAAAGYSNPVGAGLATYQGPVSATGLRSAKLLRGLLAAPYHLLSLLDNFADVGVGYTQEITGGNEKTALNLTLGTRVGVNDLEGGRVFTYPCQSSVGAPTVLANEVPSPIPSNLPQDFTKFGSPIAVKVKSGSALAVTSAALTPSAGGAPVALQIVTLANTPAQNVMRADSVYLLPLTPLLPGASYTASISGSINGIVVPNNTFSFTTAQ